MGRKTVHKAPIILAFIVITTLLFPTIIFHHFNDEFSHLMTLQKQAINSPHTTFYLYDYIRDIILQWTALSLAGVTILLALTQYHITKDRRLLLIGSLQMAIISYVILSLSTDTQTSPPLFYWIKFFIYFMPFTCLVTYTIRSSNMMVENQTKAQVTQDKLQYIAAHDALTGLYNRHKFEDLLNDAIKKGNEQHHVFALFMIDIDNFKSINDTLGHAQGDNLIKQFTATLTSLIRRGDVVSRIGGDEFALITATLHSPSSAKKLAERLIKGMNITYPNGGNQLVTASIGISMFPFDGNTSEELLRNADLAMYKAKTAGKNTYRLYTEKSKHIKSSKELVI